MMMPPRLPSGQAAAGAITASLNHLLAQEKWAREQLREHAGKVACLRTELAALTLMVTADGMLAHCETETPANVTIRVKVADLPLILHNRERAVSYVKLEGDADFANAIAQLAQSLRWEAEHDLQPLVGGIAATRIVAGAKAALQGVKAGQRKLAENLAEYFLEENPMLMRPQAIAEFGTEVAKTRDDVERLTKRIEKLTRNLPPRT